MLPPRKGNRRIFSIAHDEQADIDPAATNPALRAMLEGKTELAETRLSVTATQIMDRMRLRSVHLKELMDEELSIGSKLVQVRDGLPDGQLDLFGLESLLEQRNSQVRSAKRRENTECWRDLAHVMRDFLNSWEGFSKNEAKNRFLEALPKQAEPDFNSVPRGTRTESSNQNEPMAPYIQNDYRNHNPYNHG